MNTQNRIAAVCMLMSVFVLVACGSSTKPDAKSFSVAKCGLSVQMPGTPKEETRTAQAAAGPLVITLYTAMTGNSAYVVSCNDLPIGQASADEVNRMLDNIGRGAMSNIGATMDGQTPIALNGHPGREVLGRTTIGGQDAVVRARVFLVGNRMIQALVLGAKGQVSDADMAAYLESLTLTN